MVNSNYVFEIIDLYFPKNIAFNTPEYMLTVQYKRLMEKKNEYRANSLTEQIYSGLIQTFECYETLNWTNLDLYQCLEYRILLHKNQPILDDDIELMEALGGRRIDMYLFVSILGNYYYYFINETLFKSNESTWEFNKIIKYTDEIKTLIGKVQEYMKQKGYLEIDDSLAKTIVEDVETECMDKGKVTVFNCLFTDMIII